MLDFFSFQINYFNATLFIGGLVALFSSSLVISSGSKDPVGRNWFLSNIFAAVWSFGYMTMISTTDYRIAYISDLILHFAATFIPLFYFGFVIALTKNQTKFKYLFIGLGIISVLLSILVPFKNYVINVIPKYKFNYVPDAGPLYSLFTLYFFFIVLVSLFILAQKILKEDNKQELQRLKFVFFSSLFGFAGGGSVFLLTYNVNIPPYALILFSLYPILITYAIIKHKLFNVKLIATELFVFAIWIFILIRTILSESRQDVLINGLLLFSTIVVGILLIRGMIKEVQTRERTEKLANELAVANERLRELDKQKSEFVSIASHQLRSPLTAIKGYSSMILEKSFGEFPEKLKEPLERIFQSSERLVLIVEDFLNVSRIEQGRMQYDFATVKIDELAKGVIDELEPNVKRAGLEISFKKDEGKNYKITADQGKVRQVITNIIDNAIKYTPQGSISVSLNRDDLTRKVLLSIKDTGIGITEDALPRLFQKFSRAEGASITNASGTGLGLYVAKEIMKAHRGNIWVDSDGPGRGSVFYLEFMGE